MWRGTCDYQSNLDTRRCCQTPQIGYETMKSPRILIVEDERIVQLHLRRVVESMGGYVTGLAATADEALACIASELPHLVLMDIPLTDRGILSLGLFCPHGLPDR